MQEKRRDVRIGVGLKVRMKAERYACEYEVVSVNISGGGIMLVIERKLPIGAQVDLEIFLPNDEAPLRTKGKIVWLKSHSQNENLLFEKVYCGLEFIEFTEIDNSDQGRLLNFIHNQINPIFQ